MWLSVLNSLICIVGIDQVSVDAEKGTLTVIGNVDPVCVTTQVRRKTGKVVELISVGPPKPPDPKPQPSKPPICLPPCCKECQDMLCRVGRQILPPPLHITIII
ncbi:hypothetical protein HYC85_017084 [Camellia sinensis]|uniref:HMA domain-containing protein n=1 Tax=Camellia sinensis TaxID=4442 RepID=A0A7J7H522_CAMSI|nr:hypothetical protein HYC85_017084 [Camellia sinensis]